MSFAEVKDVVSEGDTVMLYLGPTKIYAIEVKPHIVNRKKVEVDNVFQCQYGSLTVMDLIGTKYGHSVNLSNGWAHILHPTPELWTATLPHRTQILYTTDISMILMQLEIGPGSIVCEAGTGSGSLSHAFLRAVGPTGHLHTCDFHQQRAEVVREEFKIHGHESRVTVTCRDVCTDGWAVDGVADGVFLDLPEPWEALTYAVRATKISGGRICSFSPCMEQVNKTSEKMQELGLTEITTMECLQKELQVRSISLPVVTSNGKKCNGKFTENDIKKRSSPNSDVAGKRIKSNNEEPESVDGDDDNECATKDSVSLTHTNDSVEKNITSHNEDIHFTTAVPLLKMPGHTGFLTFATVPPNLNCVNNDKLLNSTINDIPKSSPDSNEAMDDR